MKNHQSLNVCAHFLILKTFFLLKHFLFCLMLKSFCLCTCCLTVQHEECKKVKDEVRLNDTATLPSFILTIGV